MSRPRTRKIPLNNVKTNSPVNIQRCTLYGELNYGVKVINNGGDVPVGDLKLSDLADVNIEELRPGDLMYYDGKYWANGDCTDRAMAGTDIIDGEGSDDEDEPECPEMQTDIMDGGNPDGHDIDPNEECDDVFILDGNL